MIKRSTGFSLLIVALLALCGAALGRVGGGHEYGGGGGGGGGGDDGEIIILVIRLLLWLCIEQPVIGIPVSLVVIIGVVVYLRNRPLQVASSYSSQGYSPYSPLSRTTLPEQIRAYREYHDPNFSRPLFLDFIGLFFTRFHTARGDGKWDALTPYIRPEFLELVRKDSKNLTGVEKIIVGSSRIVGLADEHDGFDWITVEFEANMTERKDQSVNAKAEDYYSKEQWVFRRKTGVLSKGPDQISNFACPSCGSPAELRPGGTCPYCDRVVNQGEFHWQLYNIVLLEKSPKPAIRLGWSGEEPGSELPSVYAPYFAAERRDFMQRYPDFSWVQFEERVRRVFMALQKAWTDRKWEEARPYETDHLFNTHRYWMERYLSQGMRNVLENIEILSATPVKLERDAFYESITVRIQARMKDYTIDRNQKIVGGSNKIARSFSEYWTFIRTAGFAGGESKDETRCPNCGAELKISMTGVCEYCDTKITGGNFDWILSIIEQDEAYVG